MSQNYYLYDSRAQDVNSDQTSLVAALMSHPSSIIKNTTSCSSSLTTHSIKNSHNNDNNINTTHKKSLINPALVKRKHYSKKRHLLMIPWIILAIVGIICDVIYLIIILSVGSREHMLVESISYLIGIALQILIFHHIFVLYKDIRLKYFIQQEHEIIWRNNQQLTENY